jgi:hypothetical protein
LKKEQKRGIPEKEKKSSVISSARQAGKTTVVIG